MDRERPPDHSAAFFSDPEELKRLSPLLVDPRVRQLANSHRPWRKVRPMARQAGLVPEDAWRAVKVLRLGSWRLLELTQASSRPFGLCLSAGMNERLHLIDQALGGGGPASLFADDGTSADPAHRQRLVMRSLMDEAIESARIEGAVTTHRNALDLLRSGKPARNKSERMITNNFGAMQAIKQWLGRDLSVSMLLELQRTLTEGTMDDPSGIGRIRTSRDEVVVIDERNNEVVFVPPPADNLPDRLEKLCAFANHHHTGDQFLHPVVKACILHFMIGYEHAFLDSNGRTARAVFYWYVLKNRYRVFEYLAVSQLILKGYAKYPQAYIDVELDDGDLTYFVAFKLGIIERAIQQLAAYLEQERRDIQASLSLAQSIPDLNLRQRLLIQHALKHPKATYTAKSHATSNGITTMTARTDLDALLQQKLLSSYRVGREVHYVPAPNLADRLDQGTTAPKRPGKRRQP